MTLDQETETRVGEEPEICVFCIHPIDSKAFISDELKNYRYSGGGGCADCYKMMDGVEEPTLNDRVNISEVTR